MKFLCTGWNRAMTTTVREATDISKENRYKNLLFTQVVQRPSGQGFEESCIVMGFQEDEFIEDDFFGVRLVAQQAIEKIGV